MRQSIVSIVFRVKSRDKQKTEDQLLANRKFLGPELHNTVTSDTSAKHHIRPTKDCSVCTVSMYLGVSEDAPPENYQSASTLLLGRRKLYKLCHLTNNYRNEFYYSKRSSCPVHY